MIYEIKLGKKAEEEQFKNFIASQKNFKKIESSRQVKNTDKVIVNFESSQEDLPEYLKYQKKFMLGSNHVIVQRSVSFLVVNQKLFQKKYLRLLMLTFMFWRHVSDFQIF